MNRVDGKSSDTVIFPCCVPKCVCAQHKQGIDNKATIWRQTIKSYNTPVYYKTPLRLCFFRLKSCCQVSRAARVCAESAFTTWRHPGHDKFYFFIWLVSNSQVRTADRDFTAWLRNTLKPTVRTTEFFKEDFWLVKLDWTNGTIWMTIFSFTINLLWNMQFSFFRTSLIMCTRHNAIHTLHH